MSGSTRRVGLMAQSVQVNYSLSWEEAQAEKITSVQIVELSFRVSWRAHYVSWEKGGGTRLRGSDGVLKKQQAQTKLLISYLQLRGITGKSHKVKNRIKGT